MTGDLTALLQRELARTSRGRAGYVVRALVVAAMFLTLAASLASADAESRSWSAPLEVRAATLHAGAWMTALVGLASTVLAASTFVDERDGATLDLLRLARLRPSAVVLGAFGARLVAVFGLLVAMLPVLTLCLPFGGVAVEELGALLVRAAVVGMLAAVLGGYVSITARSAIAPLAASAAFTLFGLATFPALIAGLALDVHDWGDDFSPLWTLDAPESGWHSAVVWGPAIGLGAAMSVARFRHQLTGGQDAAWRRWEAGVSAAMLVTLLATVGVTYGRAAREIGWWNLPDAPWHRAVVPIGIFGLTAFYLWLLQVAGALAARWSDVAPRRWVVPWPWVAWLVRDPVLTHDLRAHTRGLGAAAGVLYGVWFTGSVVFRLSSDESSRGATAELGGMGIAALTLIALAFAARAATDDRPHLALLSTTPYPLWRWVAARLVGVAVRIGPLLLPPVVCLWADADGLGDAVGVAVATAAWLASVVTCGLGLALVVRPAYLAWVATLAWPVGWALIHNAATSADLDLLARVSAPFLHVRDGHLVAIGVHVGIAVAAIAADVVLARRAARTEPT